MAPASGRQRLFVYNGGLLAAGRAKRILTLAGWDVTTGLPGPDDWVGVWGQSPTSPRGKAVARLRDAPVLRVEDAFLRSLHPGRTGEPTLGLVLDRTGVHFDGAHPSDLETLLAGDPLDDAALLDAATSGIERLKYWHVSKFAAVDPDIAPPAPGYVLVVDQVAQDASVTASGAGREQFVEMLAAASIEHPGRPILIKTHPETAAGHRPGHFGPEDETVRARLYDAPISPWRLLEGAHAVYTLSSGLGFETILAGQKPVVFGQPFYAGWGLTDDRAPIARRRRWLSAEQLFAGALIRYPVWYDPYRDGLASLDQVIDTLAAQAKAWRRDRKGWVATGMSRWKRGHIREIFGGDVQFERNHNQATRISERSGRRVLAWATKMPDEWEARNAIRTEDGFLRSRGLGAALTPPMSLIEDDIGIHYDPSRTSRLEQLIADSADLPVAEIERSERLMTDIRHQSLSKYNQTAEPSDYAELSDFVLVPGQVEDDASVRKGAGDLRTNIGLLRAVRETFPDEVIVYKPHPDVEAGLRTGKIERSEALTFADHIAEVADPLALIAASKSVWTISSGLGFEALIRSVPVTCLGVPFYAGWGLTTDLGPVPDRRTARPTLAGLTHAALIGYPRYWDPVARMICPPEVTVDRLASGKTPHAPRGGRLASKARAILRKAKP